MEPMQEYSVEDLLEAVKAGRVDDMLAILDAGHVDVNAEGKIADDYGFEDSRTALAYACEIGRNDALAFLLSRDSIQVNGKCGNNGVSALMYASQKGHAEVVRMLLDHGGVDINVVGKYSGSRKRSVGVNFDRRNSCRNGESALMYASLKGHAVVVRMLLDHGVVDINVVDH
ncbi:hypothetical protein As57867_002871, partial [Aphanomyces stellatus]